MIVGDEKIKPTFYRFMEKTIKYKEYHLFEDYEDWS